ncbi:MAG: hypothetical protein JSS43_01520 [Proteobacteria bacterium]|nr:hypothetical protein [Pseudomonadota bacterium]
MDPRIHEQVAFQMVPVSPAPRALVVSKIAPQPVAARPPAVKPGAAKPSSVDPAGQCETAVTTAEFVHRLPARLLGAIALTETGRKDPKTGTFRPWPYSINAEGQGMFFGSAQEAIATVRDLQGRGVQSIDVGCMQVNLMYHPRAFASLEDAFDPRKNALYAGQFLNALYVTKKDWMLAAGAYHSETPERAEPYRQMVAARWTNPTLRNQTPPQVQYRDFVSFVDVYGAFAQTKRVYGSFTTGTGYR